MEDHYLDEEGITYYDNLESDQLAVDIKKLSEDISVFGYVLI